MVDVADVAVLGPTGVGWNHTPPTGLSMLGHATVNFSSIILFQNSTVQYVLQARCSGSSKVACEYSNRLCQWNATYAFGATVLGGLVG